MTELGDRYRRRRDELLRRAGDGGLRGVVAVSSARHSLLAMDAVWWLTGFKPMLPAAVMFDAEGRCTIGVAHPDRVRAEAFAEGCTLAGYDSLPQLLSTWQGSGGFESVDVGICGVRRSTRAEVAGITSALGRGWQPIDSLLESLARVRDEIDIALAEQATALAEKGASRLCELLVPGMAEYEAVAELDAALRELGSEDSFLLVSASQHNRAVHRPGDRLLGPGDILLAEISPSREGVYTQICRSIVVGEPSPAQEEDYSLLVKAFESGLSACRPGTPVPEVVGAMDEVLTGGGLGEYCRPPHMRARGHALGLGSSLPGDLTARSGERLADGDYFVLHPNQYIPRSGYMLCGAPVCVGPGGARPLGGLPTALEVAGSEA